MKTFQTILIVASFALIANYSNAQLLSASANAGISSSANAASMKAAAKLQKASLKAFTHFKRDFKTTSGEQWNVEENVITASFKEGAVKSSVVYTKNGNWLRTMKVYPAENIPDNIFNLISSSQYTSFIISQVQEIHEPMATFYIVHLEDDDQYILLSVYEDELNVYKKYRKQKH